MDYLALAQFGVNLGALAGVLMLIARGSLVARSWADALVKQANENAAAWKTAAEASDRRADLMVQLVTEQTAAMRAVEALVRTGQRGGPT